MVRARYFLAGNRFPVKTTATEGRPIEGREHIFKSIQAEQAQKSTQAERTL